MSKRRADQALMDYLDRLLHEDPDDPVFSDPVFSAPVFSEPVVSDPVVSEPVVSEPVMPLAVSPAAQASVGAQSTSAGRATVSPTTVSPTVSPTKADAIKADSTKEAIRKSAPLKATSAKADLSVTDSSVPAFVEPLLAEKRSRARPHAEPEPATPSLLPVARSRLQQLLDRVADVAPTTVTESTTTASAVDIDVDISVTTATMPAVALHVESAPVATAVSTTEAVAAVATETLPHPVSAVTEAVRYSNAQYRADLPANFPTLVFRIDELKLALPLHLLGGIQRRDKPLTPLVGRADWFLGLMPHEPDNLNVVDTARYLLGERYRPEMVDGYRYVIRIGDTPWGLACTDLCATRSLSQEEVRWYDSNPQRPWLAGMMKEDRCALLNAQALIDAFELHGQRAA